jgi:hypothetical protein
MALEIRRNDFHFQIGAPPKDKALLDVSKVTDSAVDGIWEAMCRGYDVYLDSFDRPPRDAVQNDAVIGLFSLHHGARAGGAVYGTQESPTYYSPAQVAEDIGLRSEPLSLVLWAQCFGGGYWQSHYRNAFGEEAFRPIAAETVGIVNGEPQGLPINSTAVASWLDENFVTTIKKLPDLTLEGGRRGHLFDKYKREVRTKEDLVERLKLFSDRVYRGPYTRNQYKESKVASLKNPVVEDLGRDSDVERFEIR